MAINSNVVKSLFQRLKNAGTVLNNTGLDSLTTATVGKNPKVMEGVGNVFRRIGNDLGNSGLPATFDFGEGIGTVGENLKYLPRVAHVFDVASKNPSTSALSSLFDQYKYW